VSTQIKIERTEARRTWVNTLYLEE